MKSSAAGMKSVIALHSKAKTQLGLCEEKKQEQRGLPPHHVETGGQLEQDSAVLVQLLQRAVEEQNQIHVLLG